MYTNLKNLKVKERERVTQKFYKNGKLIKLIDSNSRVTEYFYNENGLINYGGSGSKMYDETWFRYWGFRLPVNLELQHYVNGSPFFLTIGPEIEYRFAPRALGRVDGGKQQVISKNYDLNPLNVNLMAQVGYGNIGFMAKLSLVDLFQNPIRPEPLIGGEGASVVNCEVYPLMVGFSIFY